LFFGDVCWLNTAIYSVRNVILSYVKDTKSGPALGLSCD